MIPLLLRFGLPEWAAKLLAYVGLPLLLLGAVWWWHSSAVSSAYARGAHDGAERAYSRVEDKALALKKQADETTAKIRSRTDEAARTVDTVTRTVLVRGPGAATCRNPATPSAGGRDAASGAGDAPPTGMPSEDRAAVPWGWLVESARQCDLNALEVRAWRDQHEALEKAWRASNSPSGSDGSR